MSLFLYEGDGVRFICILHIDVMLREDVLEAAPKMLAKIKQEVPDVNCVVPITHQLVAEDVKLALTGSYPVILGGHEHEPFTDVHNGA